MADPLRSIDVTKLDPDFLTRLRAMLDAAAAHGIVCVATSGWRSSAVQALLYKKFLAGGPRAAPPGRSLHEKGRAVDLLVYRGDQPVNDGDDPSYAELHTIAERYGLQGLPPALHDMGHIELP